MTGRKMDFDYDSLVVLSAVVRTGSFEAAAKSLDVTQSAVSQRIKQLEEKVGSILILRGRPCTATEDGLLLCQHVEQVMLMRHELSQQLAARGGMSNGRAVSVRIAVNSDSLATWFPEVVKRAAEDLNLRSGDALAIVTSSGKSIPGCRIFPLGAMDYMAVASPEYFEAHLAAGVTVATVAASPSIRFDRKDTLPQQWMMLAFGDAAMMSSHYVPSYEGHLICCRNGIGWAMMPRETVGPMVEAGELREVMPGVSVRIPLFWQSRSQSSTVLQELSSVVSEVAAARLLPSEPGDAAPVSRTSESSE